MPDINTTILWQGMHVTSIFSPRPKCLVMEESAHTIGAINTAPVLCSHVCHLHRDVLVTYPSHILPSTLPQLHPGPISPSSISWSVSCAFTAISSPSYPTHIILSMLVWVCLLTIPSLCTVPHLPQQQVIKLWTMVVLPASMQGCHRVQPHAFFHHPWPVLHAPLLLLLVLMIMHLTLWALVVLPHLVDILGLFWTWTWIVVSVPRTSCGCSIIVCHVTTLPWGDIMMNIYVIFSILLVLFLHTSCNFLSIQILFI